ncbi:MAG TPA: LysM peptidoglycan-binding domain-containing protein, partial [Beijerinckiaceae bacterium]
VELLAGDQKMGEAQADADGQFVILPKTLAPGDHVLSLRVGEGEAAQTSRQTVAIAVPRPAAAPGAPESQALAAVAEPGQPTRNLAEPRPAANELRIGAAEAQEGGGLLLSGVAPAGSQLRLYLNDSYVASATSGADGRWSLKVERGMSAGGYAIRADVIGPDGKPTARAEAPFEVPVALAAKAGRIADAPARDPVVAAGGDAPGAKAPAPAAGQVAATETGAAAPSPAQAVVEDLRTAKVARGDSLWRISRTIYGEGMRYTTLYDANTSQIRNPNLIYPGQVLVVPKQEEGRAAPAAPRR